MKTLPENVDAPAINTDHVALDPAIPNTPEKRSHDDEESENHVHNIDRERKKLKINDENDNNDKPAMSKKQMKKFQKQQKWLDLKAKRK